MSWWSLLGALLFGVVFAVFRWHDVDPPASLAATVFGALVLFGTYCGLVIVGTADKRRTLSITAQTALGVACALAVAAVVGADLPGYGVAAGIGLVLGYTADLWVRILDHV